MWEPGKLGLLSRPQPMARYAAGTGTAAMVPRQGPNPAELRFLALWGIEARCWREQEEGHQEGQDCPPLASWQVSGEPR